MILRLLLVEFVMKDAWIALEDMKIPSESLGVFRSLSYNSILGLEVQMSFLVL
ncbi:hypothetical protein SAMN04487992_104114 [Cellulophaga baltica]|uniref:Uncharacterized protein n=1 Tax=Cellulophaga baltica TaxID=76594 RepID=A0A1G7G433_9FLAO|nr:hypothetical protein SAMN04487992_104114 [Cellulophaga baltica]